MKELTNLNKLLNNLIKEESEQKLEIPQNNYSFINKKELDKNITNKYQTIGKEKFKEFPTYYYILKLNHRLYNYLNIHPTTDQEYCKTLLAGFLGDFSESELYKFSKFQIYDESLAGYNDEGFYINFTTTFEIDREAFYCGIFEHGGSGGKYFISGSDEPHYI